MKKIAFLIPTYYKHFVNVKKLYNSYIHFDLYKQADFYIIFTNEEEKKLFGDLTKYQNFIIYDSKLGTDYDGIINKKKFYGLNNLKEKYEYIIVLDSETIFIKNIDLKNICDEYFNNKVLYGNKLNGYNIEFIEQVLLNCKRFYSNNKDISKLNTTLYLWFNQPCIYKCDTIKDFFNIIDYDKNIDKLKYVDFDYYIYMNYLILYHNFIIKDIGITCQYGLCENLDSNFLLESTDYKEIEFMQSSYLMFEYLKKEKLFMFIHTTDICDINILNFINNFKLNISNVTSEINELKDKYESEINELKDKYESEINKFNIFIDAIAWWIPIKQIRENFRNKFKIRAGYK